MLKLKDAKHIRARIALNLISLGKDASGNTMATYKTTHIRIYTAQPQNSTIKKQFYLEELYIYPVKFLQSKRSAGPFHGVDGSNRLGVLKSNEMLSETEYGLSLANYTLPDSTFPALGTGGFSLIQSTQNISADYTQGQYSFSRGHKQYELCNHLGNVLVTIQDRKWGFQNNTGNYADYYLAYIQTTTDYYAFGSTITERSASFGEKYRYGFNNQEHDGELGDYYSFEYRLHDARLGRFLSMDPLYFEYVNQSVYVFAGNGPLQFIDRQGLGIYPSNYFQQTEFYTIYKKMLANDQLAVNHYLQEYNNNENNLYLGTLDSENENDLTTDILQSAPALTVFSGSNDYVLINQYSAFYLAIEGGEDINGAIPTFKFNEIGQATALIHEFYFHAKNNSKGHLITIDMFDEAFTALKDYIKVGMAQEVTDEIVASLLLSGVGAQLNSEQYQELLDKVNEKYSKTLTKADVLKLFSENAGELYYANPDELNDANLTSDGPLTDPKTKQKVEQTYLTDECK
jgi:RHS repeat-associated protein